MQIDMEETVERHGLQDRVTMLGAVPHHNVRDVLASGHIFLNCSLTEAFCIAIVEAVSCGLLCVSTRVGGVPEVLPDHMIKLAEPNGDDLIEKVKEAIEQLPNFDPLAAHEQVKSMYSWFDVAQRTEVVYDRLLREERVPLIERLRRFYACGLWAGKIFCVIVALAYVVSMLLEWWSPATSIERAPNLSYHKWQQHIKNKTRPSSTMNSARGGLGASGISGGQHGGDDREPVFTLPEPHTPKPAFTPGHSRQASRTLGRSVAGSMEVLWEELTDDLSTRPSTPAPVLRSPTPPVSANDGASNPASSN